MDQAAPQQLNQLTDAITTLTTEMRAGFARVDEQITDMKEDISGLKDDVAVLKDDVAKMKQDIAALQTGQEQIRDDIYNLQVNLEDLDKRMQIGFAETKSQISAINTEIATLNRNLFLERGTRETEVDSLGETQDAAIASTNRRIDDIETFLRGKFSEYRQRAA